MGHDIAGTLLRNPRTRGYFEDGLRTMFPPSYEPLPAEIKELLNKLHDGPRED